MRSFGVSRIAAWRVWLVRLIGLTKPAQLDVGVWVTA